MTPCKIACFFVDWNEGIQVSFILPFRFSVWQWAQLLPAPPVVREPRIPCWRTWEGWWRRHNWTRCHQKRSNNWRRSRKLEVSWVSWVFSRKFLRRSLPNSWILSQWLQGKSSFQEFDQEIKQDAVELVQPQQILEAERKSNNVPSNLGSTVKVDRDPILKWWSPMNLLAEHHNTHVNFWGMTSHLISIGICSPAYLPRWRRCVSVWILPFLVLSLLATWWFNHSVVVVIVGCQKFPGGGRAEAWRKGACHGGGWTFQHWKWVKMLPGVDCPMFWRPISWHFWATKTEDGFFWSWHCYIF